MQEHYPSAAPPTSRWRRAKLVAGALALTASAYGAVAVVSALPASATNTVTSAAYTIGTPSGGVNSVSATPTSTVQGSSNTYVVTFIAAGALSNSASSSVTVTPSAAFTIAPSAATASLIDLTSATCFQAGVGTAAAPTTGSITFTLISGCTIASGDKVQASFTAGAPATATTSYTLGVTTSANATSVASNSISNTATPPVLSASNTTAGANAIYTIASFGAANGGILTSTSTLVLTSVLTPTPTTTPPVPTIAFTFSGTSAYTVTYTPSGGTATADTVTGAVLGPLSATCAPTATPPVFTGCNMVTLTLGTAIPASATATITAAGTNPSGNVQNAMTIAPSSSGTSTGATETTNTVTFGSSPSAVTLSVTPSIAGASATYTVTFKPSTAVAAGGSITVAQPNTAFTGVSGVLVSDTTAAWNFVTNAPVTSTANTLTVTGLTKAMAAGDAITMTIAAVTNPGAGTYSNFTVATSSDSVGAAAPAYTITVSGSAGVIVTPNPTTVSALSTYTVNGLFASAAMTGGVTQIDLTANTTTTTLPNNKVDYVITDLTTSSGSGTASAVSNYTGNGITITVPNAINSGDQIVLTISDVINPGASSSNNTMTFIGLLNGPSAIVGIPNAAATWPSGGLINCSGTIYVGAGGSARGVPSQTVMTKILSVNHAQVQKCLPGTVASVAPPRVGTLMSTAVVNGNHTIYVVGTDGQLHGFSTPKQYKSFGYDPAVNVTVPNLTGLTIGSTVGVEGAAANACSTSADGTIAVTSPTYYVFAGGRAFGIPTQSRLAQIRTTNTAVMLTCPISTTQTGHTIASGVLITLVATSPATVYVSNVGNIFGFPTEHQLMVMGYGGTPSVAVPNLGGLSVVKP